MSLMCSSRGLSADVLKPGAAIEILEFEARGTLNLIARKRRERVKFIMPILYEIS